MSLKKNRTERGARAVRGGGVAAAVLLTSLLTSAPAWAQTPDEVTRNPHGPLAIACSVCHTATSWTVLRATPEFDHSTQTSWPLIGTHSEVACADCHVQTVFSDVESTCAGCHADIHRRQFGTACEDCHSEHGWQIEPQAIGEHLNRFPLQGAHAAEDCESCHKGAGTAAFTGLSTECIACHAPDYAAATPDHTALAFPTDCAGCHSLATWTSPRFDHGGGRFPLTGAHASISCDSCHVGNQFTGIATACVDCHLADFTGTTNPDHLAANFPQDCALCHSTGAWVGAGFDHGLTMFPLTGAHVSLSCDSCHAGGQFAGLPTTCVSCHMSDFNQTTTPDHLAAGFSTSCEICHKTSAWPGAVFDHSTTRFPLLGAHVNGSCTSCHVNNVFAGTPTDCYSCHSAEYQTVTNPSHTAAGFPTTCDDCHGNNTWTGATFTHSWFPIYSGAHRGEWSSCSTCHTNPSNFTVFSCLNCHEHSQSSMDSHHSGVGGYSYNSISCYSCHPNGRH
jgi:hypothetical protein